jgi:hypothetical protein
LSAIPTLPFALIGGASLIALAAVLIFGSYTREIMLRGVISGAREEVVSTVVQASGLRVGENVLLEFPSQSVGPGPFHARISSVAAVPAGESAYRVGLEIPAALRSAIGVHFFLRVPLERRHVYQWVIPCLSK